MPRFTRTLVALSGFFMVGSTSGCMMPVGYSYVKDANALTNAVVTVVKVEPAKIYDATAVSFVGPLAGSKATGVKYTVTDALGKTQSVLQPATDKYMLHIGDKARFIAVRGQVWIQPIDYPLPPEFGISNTASITQPLSSTGNVPILQGNATVKSKPTFKPTLTAGWMDQPLPDAMKAFGATLYALNGSVDGGLVYIPNNRSDISDFKMFAEGRRAMQATALKNPVKTEVRYFEINGHTAASFEVTGETGGQRFTYFQTIVETESEVRTLNMWALVSRFSSAKPSFEAFARQLGQ